MPDQQSIEGALPKMKSQQGVSVAELSLDRPVLLVFLRHFGCMFCRQALRDISDHKNEIEKLGAEIVFVHLAEEEIALPYFEMNSLEHHHRISDPKATWYKAFGLLKGTFRQLMGLQVIMKGFQSAVIEGNGMGVPIGDGFQMPGIFVVRDRKIINSYVHRTSSDRPNYILLIESVKENG